jgi:hypothetical protein
MYRGVYGASLVKDVIHSIFWKESLAVANHIRAHKVDLGHLLQRNPKLRFLLPVRNPLDCAVSNLKTGHVSRFNGLDARAPIERVVLAILAEFRWVLELQERHPDRFFCFFAHEFGRTTVGDMAGFLALEEEESWRQAALEAFDVENSYRHSEELVGFYATAVRERFSSHPGFAAKLLRFVDGTAGVGEA